MPKVFIIILNWNGWEDTLECLESLNKLSTYDVDNLEVILVDNASKDRPPQVADNFSNLKITQIFNEQNLGFAGGNNVGIKLALERGAEYVLLLNNDTIVEPDFLAGLVEEAQNDERAGIVGPLIYFHDDPPATPERSNGGRGKKIIWSAGGKITEHFTRGELIGYQETDEGHYQVAEQVAYISGTCLLIKTEVIKKIGLISEDYFLYYEDTDWCVRAKRAGWRSLVVPRSKIYHKVSRSTQEFSYPYIYYHSRNGLMFAERFGSKVGAYLFSFWIAAKQLVKMSTHYKREWAKPVLRGVWDFWRNKKGKLEGYY